MRDHELELIAALVEGRLDDESEARALIASSPELREEYEAQRLAYEALRDAGSVALSEQESSALRRDVWTELRSGAVAQRTRTPWYYRWIPVTAGLFVVVGLVAVLGQVGGGDDAASDETMRLADAPVEGTTSTAQASEEVDEDSDGGEAVPGGGAETATTAATEAAGDTNSDADSGADSGGSAAQYADEAEMVRQGDYTGGELESYDGDEAPADQVVQCLETLGIGEYQIVATLPADAAETTVEDATTTTVESTNSTTETTEHASQLFVAIPIDVETAAAPVAFVDIEGCDLVHLDR